MATLEEIIIELTQAIRDNSETVHRLTSAMTEEEEETDDDPEDDDGDVAQSSEPEEEEDDDDDDDDDNDDDDEDDDASDEEDDDEDSDDGAADKVKPAKRGKKPKESKPKPKGKAKSGKAAKAAKPKAGKSSAVTDKQLREAAKGCVAQVGKKKTTAILKKFDAVKLSEIAITDRAAAYKLLKKEADKFNG